MSEVKQSSTERNRSIPKLRFSEFSDEWETLLLNKAVRINPKSEELPDSFIYIDLESVTNGILSKQGRISKKESPSRAQRLLKKGDILYQTVRPYQKNNYYFDKEENDYVASTGYAQLRTENESSFVFQYLHTDFFVNKVLLRCTGTSYPSINSADLAKIKINIPSLEEQQKIATFLTAVDKKIALLQQKKALLEQYKKGVMQKIFSQELRFKDDNGNEYSDWEEKELGQIGIVVNGLTYSPKDIDTDGVLVLRSSNVQNRLLTFDDNVYVNVNEGNFNPVKKDDILICVRNGSKMLIGKNAIIDKQNEGIAFGAFMAVYRSDYNRFLFHLLDTDYYKKQVHRNLGATINSINGSDLRKFKVPFPSIEEQTKIANFLSAIDTKINLVAEALEATQQFKKGLLQQLFV